MSIRDQVKKALYGNAIGSTVASQLPLFTLGSTDQQSRALKPYVLQKHFIGGGGHFRSFWYFGKATDTTGAILPGCANLTPYPMRIYDDAGAGGYGSFTLGTQGVAGRAIITSARANFTMTKDNTNTAGTGLATNPHTDFSLGTAALDTGPATGSNTALTTTKGNIVASTAADFSGGSASALALSSVNTTITDNSGGTASVTFAALTATVTSTVVANALAQLAANENRRLGLMGLVVDGTTVAQPIYMNFLVDDADQDGGSDNGITGELLLTGVVEVAGFLSGDI